MKVVFSGLLYQTALVYVVVSNKLTTVYEIIVVINYSVYYFLDLLISL